MIAFLKILLKAPSQKSYALFYCGYSVLFMLSLLQFAPETRWLLSIIFLGSFYHLKNFLTLPALLAQLIMIPDHAIPTLGLTGWFLYHLPKSYLKYRQPWRPFLYSLITLVPLIPLFNFSTTEQALIVIIDAQLVLWVGAFLTSTLPDGLPSTKVLIISISAFTLGLLLSFCLQENIGMSILMISLAMINSLYRTLKTQVLSRIFMIYNAILLAIMPQQDRIVIFTLGFTLIYFILDGGLYDRPVSDLRRNHTRSTQRSAITS